MKRREFLTRSVGAGAASALAPVSAIAAATAGPDAIAAATTASGAAAKPQSRAWFEQWLDQEFTLHRENGEPVRARLVGVRSVPGTTRLEQFTLSFRVSGGDPAGGLFEAEHPKAGRFRIRMSPCADLGSTLTWQAHFSLLA